MKKILFVIDGLNCGGAEKSLVTLLNNLNDPLYIIDLLIVKEGGAFEQFLPKNINKIQINILSEFNGLELLIARIKFWLSKKSDSKKNLHTSQHFWSAFKGKTKKIGKTYDVAIAYGQGLPTYYVADKVDATLKYAWLNTDHQKAGYNALFDYKKYCKYTKVIAVSKESLLSLQNAMISINKSLPIEIIKDISDKDTIIQMGNQIVDFNIKENNNENVILTVCRLGKEKGLHLAVEACEILIKKELNVKWYVIGEGSERTNLELLIKTKKLQKHFILLGFKENPYPYMKSCDIYVQTSLFEGLCLTVIEASILLKPIVTTNFPTAATIITHNETGLICEMDSKSIANDILKYIDDENFKENIIKNLSELKNHDKEISLEKFKDLITFIEYP